MAFIGELFVGAGLITQEQLQEALRAKAVYGGRLGTNLVELGFVNDATLHSFLSKQLGVPAMELHTQPEPEALSRLSPGLCDRLNVLPLRMVEGMLEVASIDPLDPALLNAVQEEAGCPVRMVVAAEGRLFALMRAFLGIARPLRYAVVEVEALRAGHHALQAASLRSILRDEAFDTGDDEAEELLLLDVVEDAPLDESLVPPPVEGLDAPGFTPDDFDFEIRTQEITFQEAPAPMVTPEVRAAHAALGESLRPLAFEEALGLLENCSDRDALAQVVLRAVLWHYRRALLFTVQRGLILGWDGLGNRVDRDLAQKLMIPVNAPSVFGQTCQAQRPFVGPLDDRPITGLFIKILGGPRPTGCHLIPFVVGSRVVAILYADGALGELTPVHASELTMLATQVRRAFGRFMARSDVSQT
ncbi:MAG: hypothetical protein ABIJ09_01225 [Pseudomonadota bacterium]